MTFDTTKMTFTCNFILSYPTNQYWNLCPALAGSKLIWGAVFFLNGDGKSVPTFYRGLEFCIEHYMFIMIIYSNKVLHNGEPIILTQWRHTSKSHNWFTHQDFSLFSSRKWNPILCAQSTVWGIKLFKFHYTWSKHLLMVHTVVV